MTNITNEQKAKNAIKWIDNLPNYKQAPVGYRAMLGSSKKGYCCLGAGCAIVGVEFEETDQNSYEFKQAVGLREVAGYFGYESYPKKFYGKRSLATINDETNAGFKRISKLMVNRADWIFENEVAEIIDKHFA